MGINKKTGTVFTTLHFLLNIRMGPITLRYITLCWLSVCWLLLYWLSLWWVPICLLSLCWVSICWVSLYWLSSGWLSFCWLSFCCCHYAVVIMLIVILLIVILLFVIMLLVILLIAILRNFHYADCYYADCYYTDCHYAGCQCSDCHGSNFTAFCSKKIKNALSLTCLDFLEKWYKFFRQFDPDLPGCDSKNFLRTSYDNFLGWGTLSWGWSGLFRFAFCSQGTPTLQMVVRLSQDIFWIPLKMKEKLKIWRLFFCWCGNCFLKIHLH